MNELKVFTLEEANRLLPVLTGFIQDLQKKRELAAELEVKIDACELIAGGAEGKAAEELKHLVQQHRQLAGEFYSVVDQIHSHGCFLKDAQIGLIDFYGMMDGRVVYFCWRLGEKQIGYWHEIGEGFSNRHPIHH